MHKSIAFTLALAVSVFARPNLLQVREDGREVVDEFKGKGEWEVEIDMGGEEIQFGEASPAQVLRDASNKCEAGLCSNIPMDVKTKLWVEGKKGKGSLDGKTYQVHLHGSFEGEMKKDLFDYLIVAAEQAKRLKEETKHMEETCETPQSVGGPGYTPAVCEDAKDVKIWYGPSLFKIKVTEKGGDSPGKDHEIQVQIHEKPSGKGKLCSPIMGAASSVARLVHPAAGFAVGLLSIGCIAVPK